MLSWHALTNNAKPRKRSLSRVKLESKGIQYLIPNCQKIRHMDNHAATPSNKARNAGPRLSMFSWFLCLQWQWFENKLIWPAAGGIGRSGTRRSSSMQLAPAPTHRIHNTWTCGVWWLYQFKRWGVRTFFKAAAVHVSFHITRLSDHGERTNDKQGLLQWFWLDECSRDGKMLSTIV